MTRVDYPTVIVGLLAGVVLFFVLGVGALPLVLLAAVGINLIPPRRRRCRCCDDV